MRLKIVVLFYLLKRLLLIYKDYNFGEKSQIERGVNLDKLNCNGIKIGNNCFLVINSIIKPAITFYDEVITGDVSVVTKNITKGSLEAGNLAVRIKTIECGFFGKLKSN